MNREELELWKEGVLIHSKNLENVMDERSKLKKLFEDHLAKFFEWDDMEYDRDFNKISLFFNKGVGIVIRPEAHKDLEMDYIVSHASLMGVIRVDIYPFGLPKESELIEE